MNTDFDIALYEVLQRSRYDGLMGRYNIEENDPFDFLNSILERLPDINLNISDDYSYNQSIIGTIFVVIGVILAVVALVVLIRTFMYNRKVAKYDLSDIFEELTNRNLTVADLINLSQTAANKRLAVRYRYIASLLALDESNIIQIRPSATNAIIFNEIKNTKPELANAFYHTMDVFQRTWFGYKNITDEEFFSFANAVTVLITGTNTGISGGNANG